jgi:putative toxin-antitoxin system antitoxin component (TIGR02293 family)
MAIEIADPLVAYASTDDKNALSLVEMVRQGIGFDSFDKFAGKSPFSFQEWSAYLHLSERTMQRYRNDRKTFEPLQSEKILEIALLYNKGIEVFGDAGRFDAWLAMENLALGNIRPKALLDNSFGINMVKDELIRIESGVLA